MQSNNNNSMENNSSNNNNKQAERRRGEEEEKRSGAWQSNVERAAYSNANHVINMQSTHTRTHSHTHTHYKNTTKPIPNSDHQPRPQLPP